jgi:hypothetical protein
MTTSKTQKSLPDGFREQQRRWLAELGILDRPWLIFGAAPSPTLPDGILDTHARIDINNSGKTAQRLGLGPADLTFRKASKSWAEHPTLHSRGLIWYRSAPLLMLRLQLLLMRQVRVSSLMKFGREERDTIVDLVSGVKLDNVGRGKVTNGVSAACYAIYVGIPEVVLCGISLSQNGHSYNGKGSTRAQVEEDALVLSHIKENACLSTTEEDLSSAAGVRLWQGLSAQAGDGGSGTRPPPG